jgi:hypothetical protein
MRNIIWVSDRGSNIKKVLEEEEIVFCSGHRVNNILERLFFQNEEKNKRDAQKKKKQQSLKKVQQVEVEDEEEDEDIDEQIDDLESDQSSDLDSSDIVMKQQRKKLFKQQRLPHNRQKIIGNKSTETIVTVNHLTILKSEIPLEAKRVIDLIASSKDLVYYVKLVRIENKSLDNYIECIIWYLFILGKSQSST